MSHLPIGTPIRDKRIFIADMLTCAITEAHGMEDMTLARQLLILLRDWLEERIAA